MLRVSSNPNLQSARRLANDASRVSTPNNGNKRRSIDTPNIVAGRFPPRPRSSASGQDLRMLEDVTGASPSPFLHASPLFSLDETCASADVSACALADETLAFIAALSGETPSISSPGAIAWQTSDSVLQQEQIVEAVPGSPATVADCLVSITFDNSATAPKAAEFNQTVDAVTTALSPPASPSKKELERQAVFPKDPTVTTPEYQGVFHATLNLTFVQEMMENLGHVHHMVRTVLRNASPTSTSTSSAMAAARMLSRSLARAATRVKKLAQDPGQVLLGSEAFAELSVREGLVDAYTYDVQQAKLVGALDAEVRCVATGQCATYHRATADAPWTLIGVACAASISPNTARIMGDGHAPTGVDSTSSGGLITLADVAEQLSRASQSVTAAANLLQEWLDSVRSAIDTQSNIQAATPCTVTAAAV